MAKFLSTTSDEVLGSLTRWSEFPVEEKQRGAWLYEIEHLQKILLSFTARDRCANLHLEYAIPRMGRRVDVVLLLGGIVFVLEYKVHETYFNAPAIDQVVDYALDIKNFHELSHTAIVVPILIATDADRQPTRPPIHMAHDRLLEPLCTSADGLEQVLHHVLGIYSDEQLDGQTWIEGRYQPTPTIIEAATALFAGHSVEDLSRSGAGEVNIAITSSTIEQVIAESKAHNDKAICFVTGVPGAGKTLVGLNIATTHIDPHSDLYSVFLSGNGPLVRILHEALTRDRVARAQACSEKMTKGAAKSQVKAFIQNIHHFRDEGLQDNRAPIEHVALFDEAQRAWNLEQTARFMAKRKNRPDFQHSEAEFLISCMDRHKDWAVVVCLVGGGQEINTGEAGISAWLTAVRDHFPHWKVFAAPNLVDSEYQAAKPLEEMARSGSVHYRPELHLNVSLRSFRADTVSAWVKAVLDGDKEKARQLYAPINERFPIVLTRSFDEAKAWVREQARGSERYGLIVSSQAQRLKPYAIDVKSPIDPVHWFLNGKDDIRSSYYLEDVATEFDVQGLELDWTCVAWDADLRRNNKEWSHWRFRGNKWQKMHKQAMRQYQLNAYRVLLTRARQGMVLVVPEGDKADPTRDPGFYDNTFSYLREIGLMGLNKHKLP